MTGSHDHVVESCDIHVVMTMCMPAFQEEHVKSMEAEQQRANEAEERLRTQAQVGSSGVARTCTMKRIEKARIFLLV